MFRESGRCVLASPLKLSSGNSMLQSFSSDSKEMNQKVTRTWLLKPIAFLTIAFLTTIILLKRLKTQSD